MGFVTKLPLKSSTLTLLDVVMGPVQGGSWIGPSPTQISFPIITSPFGPDWPTVLGGGFTAGAGQLPANGNSADLPTASSLAILVWASMVTTPGIDRGPIAVGSQAVAPGIVVQNSPEAASA